MLFMESKDYTVTFLSTDVFDEGSLCDADAASGRDPDQDLMSVLGGKLVPPTP